MRLLLCRKNLEQIQSLIQVLMSMSTDCFIIFFALTFLGSEEVLRLNKKVADTVKKRLNRYYAPLEDTEPGNAKIASEHDYTKVSVAF